jgi:hypothetical protein
MAPSKFSVPRPSTAQPPLAIDDHARDNLRFIRETMERASSFTAVPGWGGVAMGITALGAAAIASRQTSSIGWLSTWMAEAIVAIGIAVWTTYSKARRAGTPVFSGPGRRFAYSFAPPLFVGALLIAMNVRNANMEPIPGEWLLLYGTGVVTGGAFSIRSTDGTLFHGAWRSGSFLSIELEQLVSRRRFWRTSHTFRCVDCEEIWRLKRMQRARRAQNGMMERSAPSDRWERKRRLRISIA